MIKCYKCNIEKDESEFYKSNIENKCYICKECNILKNKEHYSKNKSYIRQKQKISCTLYRQNNVEKEKLRHYLDYLNNKHLFNEKRTRRRAMEKNQQEQLTDKELKKLRLYYQISEYLGPEWHVDHIQPISKNGLHHPDNLQIMSAKDNLSKHDRLDYKPKHSIRIENLKKELGL